MKRTMNPYKRELFWSAEDGEWIAVAPELPGCSASGRTPERALVELKTAMNLWLESRKASGWPVPKPVATRQMKGRILLRLPKSLQQELVEQAAEQGSSLNQYLLYVLARYTEMGQHAHHYKSR